MVHLKNPKQGNRYYGSIIEIMGYDWKLEKGGNAPVVQMDTVLELLEKTVALIGQCIAIL